MHDVVTAIMITLSLLSIPSARTDPYQSGGVSVPQVHSLDQLVIASPLVTGSNHVSVLILEAGRANLNHDSISTFPSFNSFPLSRCTRPCPACSPKTSSSPTTRGFMTQ